MGILSFIFLLAVVYCRVTESRRGGSAGQEYFAGKEGK